MIKSQIYDQATGRFASMTNGGTCHCYPHIEPVMGVEQKGNFYIQKMLSLYKISIDLISTCK